MGRNDDTGKPNHPGKPDAIDLANNKMLKELQRDLDKLDKELNRDLAKQAREIEKIDNKIDLILKHLTEPPKPPSATTMKVTLGDPTEKPR